MSEQANSKDIPNAISSPASVDGLSLSPLLDGKQIDLFGQVLAPASRSQAPESAKEQKMSATSGQSSVNSSDRTATQSGKFQQSLENRLRARLAVNGSPEYELTWKRWDMPSGPPICALRAKARRISDNVCSGYPTPTVTDSIRHPSPDAQPKNVTLNHAANLTGWPTASCRDQKGGYTGGRIRNGKISTDTLDVTAQLCPVGWNTPRATDGTHGGPNQGGGALSTDAATTIPPPSGYWDDSYPILCTDGKGRRVPAEPSFFPLAHGISGRSHLLHGSGNAIVHQVAATFIRAAEEARKELT